jgi:hypothetical protein
MDKPLEKLCYNVLDIKRGWRKRRWLSGRELASPGSFVKPIEFGYGRGERLIPHL